MSERVMEGAWNSGGSGTSTNEVWSAECIMNGLVPIASQDLTLFGHVPNGMLPIQISQFRHRFPHPGIHFPGTGQLVGHHHTPLSLMTIPPQHSMVESTDPSSLIGPGSDAPTGQDSHPQPLDLNNHHHHGLEDSEECSEEDEDDDEVSEEEIEDQRFVHSHEQQQVPMSSIHASLAVNEDSLPSCQHSQQPSNTINGDSLQANLIPGMDESCHQKNSLLPNGLSHRHPHVEEIPAMTHAHPLNSNPISAIPMITGNPLLLSDSPEDGFSENHPPPPHHENDSMDGDPNIGQSVHGKMYVEERVVFHLKQWTDSGFGSFNTWREEHQTSQLNRCAVCRLKSPNGQENLYSNQQKDAHRHPVKGVLFTFEDCIIVELYPEQLPGISCNSHPLPLDPKQNIMEPAKADHPIPISSYLNPPVETHNHNGVQMESIVTSSISLDKPTGPTSGIDHPPEDETQGQRWWDEFDSQSAGTEENTSPGQNVGIHQSACIMNHKLEAQSMQHAYQQQHSESQEKPLEHDGDSNNELSDYHYKWKCDRCEIGFVSSDQFEAHRCLSTLTIPEPEPVDTLDPNTEFIHREMSTSENLIHTEATEINGTMEIGESIDVEIHTDVKPKSKASTSKQEQRAVDVKTLAKYACPICQKSFNLKKLLKQHLDEQHELNPFRCTQCNTQFADEKRSKKHSCTLSVHSLKSRQNKQAQVKVSIEAAAYTSDSNSNLNDPNGSETLEIDDEEVDSTEGAMEEQIETADYLPSTKFNKTDSMGRKTNKKSKAQRVKSRNRVATLNRQTDTHSQSKKPVDRDESEGELDVDEDYDYEEQTRFLRTSPNHVGEPAKNRNKKGFKCNICGRVFSVERRLINHKATHTHKSDRYSQCEKCGKKFARKDKLIRHMYVHNEEKMFSCEICEKRFSRRDKLTDHLKSHGTDELHNCPMCQKQFLRPDILKQHVKLHRMGNKHQCPECLRFVTGQDRLKKHMARHEEAKALGQTLLCPLCTKYFIQRQSLKAHIKKFHPEAMDQLESESGLPEATFPFVTVPSDAPESNAFRVDKIESDGMSISPTTSSD